MDRNQETELKILLEKFTGLYIGRDKSVDFSKWLAGQIRQEMPDMTENASETLSGDIIEAVAKYDHTLSELNKAVETGQSKEEWFADRMSETYSDMPSNEAGNKLVQIESEWTASNIQLMQEIEDEPEETIEVLESEVIDDNWNEYSLKSKALDIGKQAVMSGLGATANIIKENIESGENDNISGVIGYALREGIETAKGEVKAVVAGAVKTAAEKGLTNLLPEDASVETISDISCVAVESTAALFDVATGKITMSEGLEKAGKAGIAAAAKLGANALKGALASIPVVGPIVVKLSNGLLDHMKSPKFTENVYTVVRDAARATWEGIKETGRGIWNKIKNFGKKILQ